MLNKSINHISNVLPTVNHVLNIMKAQKDENDNSTPKELLIAEIEAVTYPIIEGHLMNQVFKLVNGGMFLIYYNEQREFIDTLDLIQPKNRKFHDHEIYQRYQQLIYHAIKYILKNDTQFENDTQKLGGK